MLKKKILASNLIFCSVAHENNLLEKYFDILNDLFNKISKFDESYEDFNKILETKVSFSGIRESSKS
mgnify:FL=1